MKVILILSRFMVLNFVSTPRSGRKLNRNNEPQRNYSPHPQTAGLRVWGYMLFITSFLLTYISDLIGCRETTLDDFQSPMSRRDKTWVEKRNITMTPLSARLWRAERGWVWWAGFFYPRFVPNGTFVCSDNHL